MKTSATNPSDAGLDGITATVACSPYAGELAIYKHGFLTVSPDGRYLMHRDGTPFFYLGDTHWILPHERFSTSNAPGVASQFKYVVDKRVSQGFTVYQSEPIWQPHGGGAHNGADEEKVANLTDGFSASDLPGFANLDRKFKYIADKGLLHANAECEWGANPVKYPIYTPAYMTRLTRYWVARYGAYPVMWTIAQEIDKNQYNAYNETTMEKWYAVGQAIEELDEYKQPILPHMENTGNTVAANSSWKQRSYHHGWAVQWQGQMEDLSVAKGFWNAVPTKPSLLYEAPYDQFWVDSRGSLGFAYKAFQLGMYGYGYGASGVWNDIYSKQGEAADYGTEYEMPNRYLWWYMGANLETGNQLTHFHDFYTRLQWWKLIPRFDDAAWSSFDDKARSLLSSDGKEVFVVFFWSDGTGTGSLVNFTANALHTAQWFNPRTGAYTALGEFYPIATRWRLPNRPTAEDWVLLVKKSGNVDTVAAGGNLALGKTYRSSSDFTASQTAPNAFDSNDSTDWQAAEGRFAGEWLEVDFGGNQAFNTVALTEYGNRTTGYRVEYWSGAAWHVAYAGSMITNGQLISFPSVTGSKARIYFVSGLAHQPIIYEFGIFNRISTRMGFGKAASSNPVRFHVSGTGKGGAIRFALMLDAPGYAEIKLVDLRGKSVARIGSGWYPAGRHEIEWNAGRLPKGFYFATVELPGPFLRAKVLSATQ